MNIKNFGIAVIIIIAVAIISIFIGTIAKEKAPVSRPEIPAAPKEKTSITRAAAPVSYGMPANTIPTAQELEESIKRADKKRAEYEALKAEIDKERLKRRAEQQNTIRQERAMERITEGKQKEKATLSEKKEVVLPSLQKRKEMESKDIISF